ncbi:ORF5 [Haliotid herpesvirus 1]|nr:ORF5 [Haliotid herpesvirus 1]
MDEFDFSDWFEDVGSYVEPMDTDSFLEEVCGLSLPTPVQPPPPPPPPTTQDLSFGDSFLEEVCGTSVSQPKDDEVNKMIQELSSIFEDEPPSPPKAPPPRYFSYDDKVSLLDNVKAASKFHRYSRNGHYFVSHRHRLAHDPWSEHIASQLYTRCMQRGNNHHVVSEVIFDKEKRRWEHGRVKNDDEDLVNDEGDVIEDPITRAEKHPMRFDEENDTSDEVSAPVMTFDKIKVMTAPYSDAFMAKLNTANSLDGCETHKIKRIRTATGEMREVMKVNPSFPVHKTKFGPVPATRVAYKRADYTANYNAYALEKPNNCNINGTRGTHEFIIVNRINEAHCQLNNPHGKMYTILDMDCENNNSITIDSGLNGTIAMSYKSKICRKQNEKGQKRKREDLDDDDDLGGGNEDGECRKEFVLVQKAEYGTHKTTIMTKKKRFNLKKGLVGDVTKETKNEFMMAKLKAQREEVMNACCGAREIQVHAHCFNCSALGGYEIIDPVQNLACKIFEDEKILVSIAANNIKGMSMVMSNSLSSSIVNNFFDLLCWKFKVHRGTEEEQDRFYKRVLKPIAQKMDISRYNYAQAGIFCHSILKTSPMFSQHHLNLVSQKFNNPRATEVFKKACVVDDVATRMNDKWNSKRPLATVNVKSKPTPSRVKYAATMSRGPSVPDLWYNASEKVRGFIESYFGPLDESER